MSALDDAIEAVEELLCQAVLGVKRWEESAVDAAIPDALIPFTAHVADQNMAVDALLALGCSREYVADLMDRCIDLAREVVSAGGGR